MKIKIENEKKSYEIFYVESCKEVISHLLNLLEDKQHVWTDPATGLMWQVNHSDKEMTWEEAVKYCKELDYGGYNDWRLPTIIELKSIVDYSKYKPACKIENTKSSSYWSSTSYANGTNVAWNVFFYNGFFGSLNSKTYSYYARAVRGGK